jgi:hypothetical protein
MAADVKDGVSRSPRYFRPDPPKEHHDDGLFLDEREWPNQIQMMGAGGPSLYELMHPEER